MVIFVFCGMKKYNFIETNKSRILDDNSVRLNKNLFMILQFTYLYVYTLFYNSLKQNR